MPFTSSGSMFFQPGVRKNSPPVVDPYGEFKSDCNFRRTPYAEAYRLSLTWDHTKIKKCEKYLLPEKYFSYNYLVEFDLLCTAQYFKLFHFITVGDVIGFTVSGFIADIYGRRSAIILAVPILVLGSLLQALAPTYWTMYIFHCVTQASLCTAVGIGIILLLELVHCQLRLFMVAFIWLGLSVAGFLKFVLYLNCEKWPTRKLQWLINSTLVLPICTEWLLPESPHWLICHKDWKKMLDILYEMNYPQPLMINEEIYRNSHPVPLLSVKEIINILLKPEHRKKLYLGGLLFSLTYFLYHTETSRIIYIVKSEAKFSLIEGISVVMVINMGLIPLMLRYMGRPMCICSSLLILACFYCGTSVYHPYSDSGAVFGCICLVFAQTATIINGLLMVETFPTRIRSTAIGICRTVGTLMVVVSTIIQEFSGAEDSMGAYGWTIHASLMVVAAFICVLVNDTGDVPLPDTEMQAMIHY